MLTRLTNRSIARNIIQIQSIKSIHRIVAVKSTSVINAYNNNSIISSSFHSSSIVNGIFSSRSKSPTDPSNPRPLSAGDFDNEFASLVSTLNSGLSSMAADNNPFQLSIQYDEPNKMPHMRNPTSLTLNLGPSIGEYTIQRDSDNQQATLFSPVSGSAYQYRYNSTNNRWENIIDNHLLIELLVRELMKVAKGVPNL